MGTRLGASNAILLWLPPIAWAGVLFALSSGAPPQIGVSFDGIDKVEHAIAYGILGFLAARAVAGSSTWNAILCGGLAAALYGVTDEFHQSFVAGRSADVVDWYSDVTGSAIALFACWAWGILAPVGRQPAAGSRQK
jgi:VanZ family protein